MKFLQHISERNSFVKMAIRVATEIIEFEDVWITWQIAAVGNVFLGSFLPREFKNKDQVDS